MIVFGSIVSFPCNIKYDGSVNFIPLIILLPILSLLDKGITLAGGSIVSLSWNVKYHGSVILVLLLILPHSFSLLDKDTVI